MRHLKIPTILCFKILLTSLIILFFISRFRKECQQLQALIHGPISFAKILKADPAAIRAATHTKNVNQLIPDFNYLIQTNAHTDPFKADGLYPYIRYYQTIVNYAPQLSEAYGILGFCYQQEGQTEKAITAYQSAIAINPYFFWLHYNLGVLYLEQQSYAQAAQSFEQALSTRADITLKIMVTSKIYQQITAGIPDLQERFTAGLKSGYDNCVLALSAIQHHDLINHPVPFQIKGLKPRFF